MLTYVSVLLLIVVFLSMSKAAHYMEAGNITSAVSSYNSALILCISYVVARIGAGVLLAFQ
jgi:hypothetical protein